MTTIIVLGPFTCLQAARKLAKYDTSSSGAKHHTVIAEGSRPHRSIRERDREKRRGNERRGRKKTTELFSAKRINWFTPLLFDQINRAVKSVGYPWSPHAIIDHLRRKDYSTFQHRRHQRISDWRDRSHTDRFVWSESVQARIKRRHLTAERSTRFGILVCFFFVRPSVSLLMQLNRHHTLISLKILQSDCRVYDALAHPSMCSPSGHS